MWIISNFSTSQISPQLKKFLHMTKNSARTMSATNIMYEQRKLACLCPKTVLILLPTSVMKVLGQLSHIRHYLRKQISKISPSYLMITRTYQGAAGRGKNRETKWKLQTKTLSKWTSGSVESAEATRKFCWVGSIVCTHRVHTLVSHLDILKYIDKA